MDSYCVNLMMGKSPSELLESLKIKEHIDFGAFQTNNSYLIKLMIGHLENDELHLGILIVEPVEEDEEKQEIVVMEDIKYIQWNDDDTALEKVKYGGITKNMNTLVDGNNVIFVCCYD